MPKIKCCYYRRAKKMSDSVVNVVQSICETSLLRSSFPNSRNSTNILPLLEDDETSHGLSNLSLTQNLGNNKLHDKDFSLSTNININRNDVENASNDISEIEIINRSNSNDKIIDNVNTESDNLDFNDSSNFLPWLQNWAIKNHISHVALTELMIRIKPKYPELSTDARSLLRTPRKINVQSIPPGYYYHFGLRNCIEELVSRYSENLQSIQINVNIDGLPLFKSSSSRVYPILCNLVENYSEVNIIGIYYGKEKPEDPNLFLQAFTKEAIDFTINGITINGYN